MYTFELPKRHDGKHGLLKLPIGKHIMFSVHFEDQAVLRPYTPIAPVLPSEEDGTFTLCVKTYYPTDDAPYPPGGLVSNYLDCMEEGKAYVADILSRFSRAHYSRRRDRYPRT